MKNKKILGIGRSSRFSPNSTERDAAIFQSVADLLSARGGQVDCVCEDECETVEGYEAVFSMARDLRVVRLLAQAEEKGVVVLNSARALLGATRLALTECFEREGIPVPLSPALFRLENGQMTAHSRLSGYDRLPFPLWLKRSGACAQSAGDVCFVESIDTLQDALQNYVSRGIEEVLASEHLVGDLVKFYGVEGTNFFYYHYPTADNAFSKFGLERINGAPSGYPLDVKSLKASADRAASLSGITIYGGDCIVDAHGRFRIIDFNDWPSYSRCREEAALAIAEKIQHALLK